MPISKLKTMLRDADVEFLHSLLAQSQYAYPLLGGSQQKDALYANTIQLMPLLSKYQYGFFS